MQHWRNDVWPDLVVLEWRKASRKVTQAKKRLESEENEQLRVDLRAELESAQLDMHYTMVSLRVLGK
jgi:hypothetical protein